jgi:predicted MPP superfamily phosphohydrolase
MPGSWLLLVVILKFSLHCLCTPINVEYAYLGLSGYQDHDTAMAVSFFTYNVPQNDTYRPIVHYGTTSGSLIMKSDIGKSKTYNIEKGFTHVVILKNLKPNTRYYYKCGDEKYGMSKNEYDFITTNSNPNEMLIMGDMGILRSGNVMKRMKEYVDTNSRLNKSSLILHIGDVSYADDYPEFFEKTFNHWFELVQGIAPRAPYMVLPGNHDYGCKFPICDTNNQQFRAFNTRFQMLPANQKNHSMFYSFNYGPIHVVAISTETDFNNAPFSPTFGDQISWLKQDLAKANKERHIRPWILVVGHRPYYSAFFIHSFNGEPIFEAYDIQQAFEEIFHENKVDLFMAGHFHGYERQWPTYRNNITSKDYNNTNGGTIHIVNGSGGNIEGLAWPWMMGSPVWHAKQYLDDWGYGILTAKQDATNDLLQWRFFSAEDNVLRDEITIRKSKMK